MIKRLIFDLDNLLIDWKEEYAYKSINEALKQLNIQDPELNGVTIQAAQNEYEKDIKYYNKEEMLKSINKTLNKNLPMEFIDLWNENLKKYAVPNEVSSLYYNTLQYLSEKYELVILTNWFTDAQSGRLKTINFDKYFKEIYGGELVAKPYKESFLKAIGENKPEECVMIGDNFETDILGAQNVGIKNVVWRDIYNKKEEIKKFLKDVVVIKQIDELKEIF